MELNVEIQPAIFQWFLGQLYRPGAPGGELLQLPGMC